MEKIHSGSKWLGCTGDHRIKCNKKTLSIRDFNICQVYKYFTTYRRYLSLKSSLLVLHYLQAVPFIKLWTIFMNIVRYLDYLHVTTHTSLSTIRRGFVSGLVNYKKGCTRLAAASDKVYQLLAHGRWFSPGSPASSTTKTVRHDIAESGTKHQKSINKFSLEGYR